MEKCPFSNPDLTHFVEILKTDKQETLKNVQYTLVNAGWNEESLQEMPHKNFLDLAAIYEITSPVDDNMYGRMSVKITYQVMDALGVTEEELERAAEQNKRTYVIKDLVGTIVELGGTLDIGSDNMPPLYVLSTFDLIKGASALLYPEYFEQIAQKEKSDLVIIPSSIHELLVLPYKERMEAGDYEAMIREVNQGCVDREETLSDHPYFYKAGSNQITLF